MRVASKPSTRNLHTHVAVERIPVVTDVAIIELDRSALRYTKATEHRVCTE